MQLNQCLNLLLFNENVYNVSKLKLCHEPDKIARLWYRDPFGGSEKERSFAKIPTLNSNPICH